MLVGLCFLFDCVDCFLCLLYMVCCFVWDSIVVFEFWCLSFVALTCGLWLFDWHTGLLGFVFRAF